MKNVKYFGTPQYMLMDLMFLKVLQYYSTGLFIGKNKYFINQFFLCSFVIKIALRRRFMRTVKFRLCF